MARATSVLGGALGETLSGASVTGGAARPTRVGRETSPYVPRQPSPLPEAKQAEAERTFTVEEPAVIPYVPPDGGAPDGGDAGGAPGDAGDGGGGTGTGDAAGTGDAGGGGVGGGP